MSQLDLEPLLDEKDIARITRRSLASVRRDRSRGTGVKAIRIGFSIRYTHKSVRDFLHACEAANNHPRPN